MELHELKRWNIQTQLGIDPGIYGRILAFIDFANVNHWFDDDPYDIDGKPLDGKTITIDLDKLKDLLACLGISDSRFYYGHDPSNHGSLLFIQAARHVFGKHRVFTKRIQRVRHNLTPADYVKNTRIVHSDDQGDYVLIPKSNFDVEIAVDAMRLVGSFDTLCLLSADADFAALARYMGDERGKKIILIKGGRIDRSLGKAVQVKIDASQIKQYVAQIEQKPGFEPGPADSQPESTGRAETLSAT